MGYKLFGSLFLLLSGGVAAWSLTRREREKVDLLDRWIGLILVIGNQIDCYLMPIGDILASVDPSLLPLPQNCRVPLTLDALYAAGEGYLDPDAARLILAFIREIGGGYREEQVKRCAYYAEELRRMHHAQTEALPSRLRVIVTLCLAAAATAAILLW